MRLGHGLRFRQAYGGEGDHRKPTNPVRGQNAASYIQLLLHFLSFQRQGKMRLILNLNIGFLVPLHSLDDKP